jgi:hypothetical protein
LVAGIVNNVLGFLLFGLWLQPRFTAEINAVSAGLADKANTTSAMAGTIISGFVLGLAATWLYAAIRPRFGPGMKTAVIAALVICVFGFIFHLDLLYFGLTSSTTYILATVAAVIQSVATAAAGAMLYKEEGAVAPAMA